MASGMLYRLLPVLILALLQAGLCQATPSDGAPYVIEVIKSQKKLLVRHGDRVEKVFQAAVGKGGPGDKLRRGDHKTPVGTYRIVGFNPNSRYSLFMQLNYPNIKDAFFGLKGGLISREQFDAIVRALKEGRLPPQDTPLGGAIGIHGLGEENGKKLVIHRNYNWTEGCIALTNAEVRELRRYITIGTKVVIRE
ncbi:MAG: L,D-transpeptidase [Gammaproteobacteria bacterium]|nr:MAG: L,D-transpeptidase [Gammaproteobacteria bacterium]